MTQVHSLERMEDGQARGRRVEIPEEGLQGIDHGGPQQLWQGLEC